MKAEWALADRAAAVRAAGRGWLRAGLLDAPGFAALEARFPDDRARVGPVFRVLLFVFTLVALGAVLGSLVMILEAGHVGESVLPGLSFVLGLGGVLATEQQIGRGRRRQGGTESATSLVALVLLLGAAAWWLIHPALDTRIGWFRWGAFAACLLVAAAWRWGYPFYAAASAAALFLAMAQLPGGRLWWILIPVALGPVFMTLSVSSRLPPAHRRSALAAALVAFAALYVAVHIGSWDAQSIEELGGRRGEGGPANSGVLWWAAVVATAALPVAVIAWSVARRRVLPLLAGAVAAGVSVATLRAYLPWGPLWLFLCAVGALVLALSLAVWRWLELGRDGERHGFTAAPLFTDQDRQSWLESAAAVMTPVAVAKADASPGFEGGGGRSGGGGASAEF